LFLERDCRSPSFVSWRPHRFPRSLRCALPPRPVLPWLAVGAIVESVRAVLMFAGYFASALDFVILMKLSGLIWNGILGFLLLRERISRASLRSASFRSPSGRCLVRFSNTLLSHSRCLEIPIRSPELFAVLASSNSPFSSCGGEKSSPVTRL